MSITTFWPVYNLGYSTSWGKNAKDWMGIGRPDPLGPFEVGIHRLAAAMTRTGDTRATFRFSSWLARRRNQSSSSGCPQENAERSWWPASGSIRICTRISRTVRDDGLVAESTEPGATAGRRSWASCWSGSMGPSISAPPSCGARRLRAALAALPSDQGRGSGSPMRPERTPGKMVRPAGFEPATPRLGIWCSILLSYERNQCPPL